MLKLSFELDIFGFVLIDVISGLILLVTWGKAGFFYSLIKKACKISFYYGIWDGLKTLFS